MSSSAAASRSSVPRFVQLGRAQGSRSPASCCVQYAIVEYWRCGALEQQSESPPLVDDGAALRWPDGPRPMEEDQCHSTEA